MKKEEISVKQEWKHCSPELLKSGVDCANTPRRSCKCGFDGSHDHLVAVQPTNNQ